MAKSAFSVEPHHAIAPLVLALDVGSSASRGGLFDAAGRPLRGRRHKVPHRLATAPDGMSEIDPDRVVEEIEQIIAKVTSTCRRSSIAGVGFDTFASSLVGVDAAGAAVTPCYTYADSRCASQVAALREELDETEAHDRTGTPIHVSYLPAKLRWLSARAPDIFERADRWLSLGEYVHLRLLGTTAAGTSTAAWTGMLDRRTGEWDAATVTAAGIDVGQLSPIHDPDRPLCDDGQAGRRWPSLAGAVWFPAVADGFSSSVGVGAVDDSTVAVAAATTGAMRVMVNRDPLTVPAGLWCYRVAAGRALVGGALNDVGRVWTWLEETLALDAPGARFDRDAAMRAAPDPATPIVLPYLSGERSIGWAGEARAVFADVSVATTAPSLFRGALEGVALTYARLADELARVCGPAGRIVAGGGMAAGLPGWLQVLADVLATPVEEVTAKRETLRGTALLALDVLAPDVPRASVPTGTAYQPHADRAPYYAARRQRFEALYDSVIRGEEQGRNATRRGAS